MWMCVCDIFRLSVTAVNNIVCDAGHRMLQAIYLYSNIYIYSALLLKVRFYRMIIMDEVKYVQNTCLIKMRIICLALKIYYS